MSDPVPSVRYMENIDRVAIVRRGEGVALRDVAYILESEVDPLVGYAAVRHPSARTIITVDLTDLVCAA